MDNYGDTKYLYILLTSVRYDSYRKMSGIFCDLPDAKRACDDHVDGMDDVDGEIVRMDVERMMCVNWYSEGMRDLPYGAEVIYKINGAVQKA